MNSAEADLKIAVQEKNNVEKLLAQYEKAFKKSTIATPISIALSSALCFTGGILLYKGITDDNQTITIIGSSLTAAGLVGVNLIWSGGHLIFKIW